MIVTTSIMAALSIFFVNYAVAKIGSIVTVCLCLVVHVITVGLFESTAIQFGMDHAGGLF